MIFGIQLSTRSMHIGSRRFGHYSGPVLTPAVPMRARNIVLAVLLMLSSFAVLAPTATPVAAGACLSSGPPGGAYSVKVCITGPDDGTTLHGDSTVEATAEVTGKAPPIVSVSFYLNGIYVLGVREPPYRFTLPTPRWADGTYRLKAGASMGDGFKSDRPAISVNLVNGVATTPVNTRQFTPATGTPARPGQPFVLAAVGDAAGGKAAETQVSDLIASWKPNLFLYLGDVYNAGSPTEFYNYYGPDRYFGRFRAITDPTVGNHEYGGQTEPNGYLDYWDNIPHYYSLNAGGWHIISLDANTKFNETSPGTAQYTWLTNDLRANRGACTIVFFHEPIFSVGPHGGSAWLADLWPLFVANGVDLVLSGHEHNYQHWQPLNAEGQVDPNGIPSFIVGTGGESNYAFTKTDSRLAKGVDAPGTTGALRLELNPAGAAYRFVTVDGVTQDSGSLGCNGKTDTAPPAVPATVTASAGDGSETVVTWAASVDDVGTTGYDIYRNGALLATTGPDPRYIDRTVTPGTSYRYQIRARDAAGHLSALSAAAAVTAPRASPSLVFQDGFESGTLNGWTPATGITVAPQAALTGGFGAQMTSAGGKPTYARHLVQPAQSDLYYRLRFQIGRQGKNPVVLLRFRTAEASLLGLYVSDSGQVGIYNDVGSSGITSTTAVSTGTWHEAEVHVRIAGPNSEIEVWLDGVQIKELSTTAALGTTPVSAIQFGESASGRTYDVFFDDIELATRFIPFTAIPMSSAPATPIVVPAATPEDDDMDATSSLPPQPQA